MPQTAQISKATFSNWREKKTIELTNQLIKRYKTEPEKPVLLWGLGLVQTVSADFLEEHEGLEAQKRQFYQSRFQPVL